MKLLRRTRARLGGALLALTAAVAILALPGLASSHDKGDGGPADAGVIQSFDPVTGLLVIDLAQGDTASGLVVERTQIRCGKPPRKERRGHGHGHHGDFDSQRPGSGEEGRPPRGEGPPPKDQDVGDNSGPGSGPPGQGEDGNDDPPGHDGTPPGASEDPGHGAEHSRRCNTDDLTVGTVVKKAEIVLTDGNAYFRVIGLARPLPVDTP